MNVTAARTLLSFASTAGSAIAMACASAAPASAQSAAGEHIVNVASITYALDGEARSAQSNISETRVDERLDVEVSAFKATVPVQAGDQQVIKFRVTNGGNGNEPFALAAEIAGTLSTTILRLAFDSDGDGQYNPEKDAAYTPGVDDPILPTGGTETVFVVCAIASSASDHQSAVVKLTAAAVTGFGAPGRIFDGMGDGGGAAIVGATNAQSSAQTQLVAAASGVSLEKSQIVTDVVGGHAPVPGSIIAYTLTARVFGVAFITDAAIADAIPAGATYVPDSLLLDGSVLTDAADSDVGAFDGARIDVSLGALNAPAERLVSFKARIN